MLAVKIQCGEDIRRVTIKDHSLSVKELSQLAQTLFRENLPNPFVLKYKDDEGDLISISSDRELEEGLRLFKKEGMFRVIVTQGPQQRPSLVEEQPSPSLNPTVAREAPQEAPDFHEKFFGSLAAYLEFFRNQVEPFIPKVEQQFNDLYPYLESFAETHLKKVKDTFVSAFPGTCDRPAVNKLAVSHPAICDNCTQRIVGVRWKCNDCPDYDLCTECKQLNIHHGHQFVKVDKPVIYRPSEDQSPQAKVEKVAQVVLPPQPVAVAVQPTTSNPGEKKEEPKKVHVFEGQLMQLKEMGFLNEQKNVELLILNNGDMIAAVQELLFEQM